jgi:hypothetical protein
MKWFAWELARYYGPALCRADSATRLAHLQAELAKRVEAIVVSDDPKTYSAIKFLRNAMRPNRPISNTQRRPAFIPSITTRTWTAAIGNA